MKRMQRRSVAEIEGFVGLLAAASGDPKINATLEKLLAMPDERAAGWFTPGCRTSSSRKRRRTSSRQSPA